MDHLKSFNDAHGHDAGDEVIQHIARIAQQVFEPEHLLCRLGGDEFVVLLRLPIGPAAALAEQLRATVESQVQVTVTVGVAARPASNLGWDTEMLLAVADHRVDYAKSFGRRNLVVAEPLPPERQSKGMLSVSWPALHGPDGLRPTAPSVRDT